MKKYTTPEIEFELFAIEDVITVSLPSAEGENEGGYITGENGWD